MPLPQVSPESGPYYTKAEVREAIGGLNSYEHGRFLALAAKFTKGTRIEPEDFLHEALARTLEVERQWKRGSHLHWHLFTTMRSMRSFEFKHRKIAKDHHTKIFGVVNRLGETLLKLGGMGSSRHDVSDPHEVVYGAQELRRIVNLEVFDFIDQRIIIGWMHGRKKMIW